VSRTILFTPRGLRVPGVDFTHFLYATASVISMNAATKNLLPAVEMREVVCFYCIYAICVTQFHLSAFIGVHLRLIHYSSALLHPLKTYYFTQGCISALTIRGNRFTSNKPSSVTIPLNKRIFTASKYLFQM